MKMNLQALMGLVLLGCNSSIKVDEVQTEEILVDVDQDGFDSTVDCDDFDLAVHPGAQEFCDGIDNNCDGQIDEGVSRRYYRDLDGDGFGDDNESLIACNAPEDYIIVGNDCDDSSATSFPGAPEICDERDNDCDGDIDEYLLDGLFLDVDGDGYGDPAHPIDDCADDLTRYARNQLDCDDSNPEIHYDALEICDEIDNDCDGAVDEPGSGAQLWYADTDGDGYGNLLSSVYACERPLGYTSDSQDCDDSSDTTYPTADEHCNLKDDDCDGFVDENPVDPYTFYLDADSDGFGDSLFTTVACNQPIGYVSNHLDCNDTTSAISPNAPEICNQTDNNCNGIPDDNAIGAATYYADIDGDTFGDINDQIHSCTPIAGRVLNSLDCDDVDPAQNPLSIETCNGEDDNCNGNTDENAIDASVWYLDADGDSYGTLTLWTTACTQPSGYVDNVLDCDDGDALHNPDTPEVCNGLDDNCNNQVDEGLALSSWYFDDDGDGFGNPWIVIKACTQPAGMIANNQDCDDLDAQHNPNSQEICNGLDDNCNNQVDEGLSRSPWYFDEDGDGFGNPWIVVEDCSQPAGMIEDNQDCNDLDPEIHPDADEVCGDGLDNNCDGRFDDETAIDAYSGYLDLDGDGYGGGEWDSSCEDIYYTLNEDCDDGDPDVNPDGNEVCDGIDNDCDGNADSASLCPCNFERNNGSNYLFCKNNRTWSVAKGECAQYGYHLVTINDATENTWLDGRVDSYSSTRWWTGYNDITVEDYWDWDGPYSTYTNWANNEPSNSTSTVGTTTGDEDCVVLNQTSNGTWNDLNCLNSLYFVCEANP